MRVTFMRSEPIAERIETFYFKPASQLYYVAGQFTELHLPHHNRDKRGDRRFYTLSSAPEEELLAVTTKFADSNGSSFKAALRSLQPGDQLDMASPMGDFVLAKDTTLPLTFVAGGIGCTPFHSMLQHCRLSGQNRQIRLIYGALHESEIAFSNFFAELKHDFIPIVGQTLDAATIIKLAWQEGPIYLSGPEPMIEALQKELRSAGVDRRRIQTDFFPGYSIV